MPVSPDPFTQVYNAIWSALTNFEPVASVVHIHNRIDYTQPTGAAYLPPQKETLNDGDVPELELRPVNGRFDLHNRGNRSLFQQTYALVITSGHERLNQMYFPLKWDCLRALARAGNDLGLSFVYNAWAEEYEDTNLRPEEGRGLPGWGGLILIRVEMAFNKTDLTED